MTTGTGPSVTVYAASDDLIEVDGDIIEEFNDVSFADDGAYVYLSTGDVLRFVLDGDTWVARVVHDVTGPEVVDSDRPGTIDAVVVISADVQWVVATTTAPVTRRD